MIYLTGDTHIPIDIGKLNMKRFPDQKNLTQDDYVIVLGDFGLYWQENETYQHWKKWLQQKSFTILWLDGNHENFDWIDAMPVTEWHGGKVHQDGNIIHLMRGQVYTIEGKTFFVMGGAESIDKECRTEGVSWWMQETPSCAQECDALENIEKAGRSVDYILTHTCPIDLIQPMFHLQPMGDPTTKILQEIYWRTKFKKWYFGHWHIDRNYGKFCCMYDDIIKLEEEDL